MQFVLEMEFVSILTRQGVFSRHVLFLIVPVLLLVYVEMGSGGQIAH